MPHLIIRVTVQDFSKWKPVYDSNLPARQAAGLKELNLWRNADKSNELVLLFDVSDIAFVYRAIVGRNGVIRRSLEDS